MDQTTQPTIKQHCELIEKALHAAQSKGVFTMMDSVNIVNSLKELYNYVEKHESNATSFKAVPQDKTPLLKQDKFFDDANK